MPNTNGCLSGQWIMDNGIGVEVVLIYSDESQHFNDDSKRFKSAPSNPWNEQNLISFKFGNRAGSFHKFSWPSTNTKTRNLFFTYQKISKNNKKYQKLSKRIKEIPRVLTNTNLRLFKF
jgi:hypothetical protein